jgi:hypothetical protein
MSAISVITDSESAILIAHVFPTSDHGALGEGELTFEVLEVNAHELEGHRNQSRRFSVDGKCFGDNSSA